MYKAMAVANSRAKPYPLIDGWNQYQSIIWDATVEALSGNKSPQQALDDAAAQIDKIRGMEQLLLDSELSKDGAIRFFGSSEWWQLNSLYNNVLTCIQRGRRW
jgi:hypothetical protein